MKHLLLLFAFCASLTTKAQVFSSELRVNPAKNTVKVTFTNITNDTVKISPFLHILQQEVQGLWLYYKKLGWKNHFFFWEERAKKKLIILLPNESYSYTAKGAYQAEEEKLSLRDAYLDVIYVNQEKRLIHYTKEFPPHTWIIE